MKRRALWLPACLAIALLGCGHRTEQYILPDEVTDFPALYKSNCAGCHGAYGRYGAARPLNDPLFLALIGRDKLRDVIARGVMRTAMPAFARSGGGTLTDQQIAILADEIEARWSRPHEFVGLDLPPYTADLGDPKNGEAVFSSYCSRCHGEDGTGGPKGGSVVNPAYLALVSDQSIRTTIIAGRAGQPTGDWSSYSPGHPMTPREISDVVAWLCAQRAVPGNLERRGTKLQ